ncbi:MAG TPA: response regulator [Xanthobacteraceae bacterium]|nr:response regulator [Xanthobacteraceae bacterium]
MSQAESGRTPFAELEVLIVEDEAIVSFLVEDMLMELGCGVVRHAGSMGEALAALATKRPDAAVLDVNLGGYKVYPLAERLREMGVPFLFASGYDASALPPEWAGRPLVQKPFQLAALAAGLRAALAGRT